MSVGFVLSTVEMIVKGHHSSVVPLIMDSAHHFLDFFFRFNCSQDQMQPFLADDNLMQAKVRNSNTVE